MFKKMIFTFMITTGLSPMAMAASSGTCGTPAAGCSYILNGGTLTISGTGNMSAYNLSYNYPPWYSSRGYIYTVVIGNGIKSVECLGKLTHVRSLTIPNSVTRIGTSAFEGMTGVTGELKIPNSVTTIGGNAFYGMTGVTGELKIPNSVTTIGGNAFYGMTSVTELTIPDGATIGSNAFKNVQPTTLTISADQLKAYLGTGAGGLKVGGDGKINIICTSGDCETYLKENSKYKNDTTILAALNFIDPNAISDPEPIVTPEPTPEPEPIAPTISSRKLKRIYTVEEAAAVSKPTGNTFRLRYK
ncbi:MAG: leucine-rich repeat domain-containing protein [Alphaproteobacteria bacterium]|nr:leucine-rich repeat domain-containing protein [Alphaproteobacteria bacterium]